MQDTYKELYRIKNSNNKKEIIDNIDIVLHTQLHNDNNNIFDIQKFYLHLYLKQFLLIIYNIIKKNLFMCFIYIYCYINCFKLTLGFSIGFIFKEYAMRV